MWRSGAPGWGLKGSLQASHQWSTLPFCLPQTSQLNDSVQVNGDTPSLGWNFLTKVAYIRAGTQRPISVILAANKSVNLPNFISSKRLSRFCTAFHRSSTKFSSFVNANATRVG